MIPNSANNIIKEIRDGYSPRAKPTIGFHDSERVVTFYESDHCLQEDVMCEMRATLFKSGWYMWVCLPENIQPNVWRINYGYDSGD